MEASKRYDFWPRGAGFAPQIDRIEDLDGDGVGDLVFGVR
jgi:hypothetical protein